MKKIGVFSLFLLVIFFINFGLVLGETENNPIPETVDSGDVENIHEFADTFTPEGFSPYKSKAEMRIEAIDQWLEDNASWMRYIFWMKPSISWLFAFNIYFILLFIVILILNGDGLFFFIENKIISRVFGAALFFIFLISGLYAGLAGGIETWRVYFLEVLSPAIGWTIIVFIVILLFFFGGSITQIMRFIKSYLERKKQAKEKMELTTKTESVKKLLDSAIKD